MINLKKILFNDVIEFYCHPDLHGAIPEPTSASKNIAPWFKNLSPSCKESPRDSFGNEMMTAKRCMPLIDGMSLGFTIPLCADLHIVSNYNNSQIEVQNPPGIKVCEFHSSNQVGGNDAIKNKHGNPLKFVNYWVIKTAPGWSTLFVPPLNVLDSPFTCLAALVDTDNYPKEVNFPAVLNFTDVDEHIPAGTPLVTAIPVKRNSFNKKPKVRKMTEKEFQKINKIQQIQNFRTHYYSYDLRVKK